MDESKKENTDFDAFSDDLFASTHIPDPQLKCNCDSEFKEELGKQKNENQLLLRHFTQLLATAHNDSSFKDKQIDSLQAKLGVVPSLTCPNCNEEVRSDIVRPQPKNVRVLRGKNTVELDFSCVEELESWLTILGLNMNFDGLPTMPKDVDSYLQQTKEPYDLTRTDSLLVKNSLLVEPNHDAIRTYHVPKKTSVERNGTCELKSEPKPKQRTQEDGKRKLPVDADSSLKSNTRSYEKRKKPRESTESKKSDQPSIRNEAVSIDNSGNTESNRRDISGSRDRARKTSVEKSEKKPEIAHSERHSTKGTFKFRHSEEKVHRKKENTREPKKWHDSPTESRNKPYKDERKIVQKRPKTETRKPNDNRDLRNEKEMIVTERSVKKPRDEQSSSKSSKPERDHRKDISFRNVESKRKVEPKEKPTEETVPRKTDDKEEGEIVDYPKENRRSKDDRPKKASKPSPKHRSSEADERKSVKATLSSGEFKAETIGSKNEALLHSVDNEPDVSLEHLKKSEVALKAPDVEVSKGNDTSNDIVTPDLESEKTLPNIGSETPGRRKVVSHGKQIISMHSQPPPKSPDSDEESGELSSDDSEAEDQENVQLSTSSIIEKKSPDTVLSENTDSRKRKGQNQTWMNSLKRHRKL